MHTLMIASWRTLADYIRSGRRPGHRRSAIHLIPRIAVSIVGWLTAVDTRAEVTPNVPNWADLPPYHPPTDVTEIRC